MAKPFESSSGSAFPKGPVVDFRLAFTCTVLLVALPHEGDAHGQSADRRVATMELDATFQEPFGYLGGVRELSDGRILAADPFNQVVLRIDMDAGTADTLGREGAGPQEYDAPDRVFPLPNDSTLLVDLGNGRYIVIDPNGKFVDWISMHKPPRYGPLRPRFVDAAGHLYSAASFTQSSGRPDTTAIHRIDRTTWVETPVAWCWHTPFASYMGPQGDRKRVFFVAYDDWAAGPDGRVAVVRAHGSSVDWYHADGRVIEGPPNDMETFPVRRRDREAAVELHNTTVIWGRTRWDASGARITTQFRGLPKDKRITVDDFAWPDGLPVFRGGTVISPRGNAWVKRMMPAGEVGRYEVYDQSGTRVGFIELPAGSTVIGFGSGAGVNGTAYVTRFDDVGWVWLERYRIVRVDG